jgi:hypothetical protein
MKESVICILDILGTKGIWAEKNIDTYFKIIDDINSELLTPAKMEFAKLLNRNVAELDFISFSDTLVVTLIKKDVDEQKDPYFFYEVINGFSRLILGIIQFYFSSNFFARGAISFGKIAKKGNHFVGPAVDDAAEYFELGDMIGVGFTPKATLAMDYAVEWQNKYFSRLIGQYVVKYQTPLKNKSVLNLYQIDWASDFYNNTKSENSINPESVLNMFFSSRNIPFVAVSKIDNSLKFFRYVGGLKANVPSSYTDK